MSVTRLVAVPEPGSASVLAIANALLRNRRLIAAVFSAIMLAALAYAATRQRLYSTTTAFIPENRRAMPGGLSGLAAQLGVTVPTGDPSESPQFYVELLSSRAILDSVVDTRFTVTDDGKPMTKTLVELLGKGDTPAIRRHDAIIRTAALIHPQASVKTGVITLTVTTRYPELSEQMATRLVGLLNEFNLHSRQTRAANERRFTEARLSAAKAELLNTEQRLLHFNMANRGDLRGAPELMVERDRLDRELTSRQAVYNTLAQAYEQARIDEVRDTPVLTLIQHPERAVVPNPRHRVRTMILAAIVGGAFAMIVALVVDRMRESRAEPLLREFRQLRRDAWRDVRHPLRAALGKGGHPS